VPQPEGPSKQASPKLEDLVSKITELNLLEVAELSDLLKRRLNLPDAPIMAMGVAPAAAAPPPEVCIKLYKILIWVIPIFVSILFTKL